jgi:hypothetical protein
MHKDHEECANDYQERLRASERDLSVDPISKGGGKWPYE